MPFEKSYGALDVYLRFCHNHRYEIVASDRFWQDFGLCGLGPAGVC